MSAIPLPAMSPALLVRALLKRASRAPLPPGGLVAEYSLPGLDRGQIAAYSAALGFAAGEAPLTYFYLLAQRAQLGSMLAPAFGHPIAGMIHAEQSLARYGRPRLDEPLTLRATMREEPPTEGGSLFVACEVAIEQGGERKVLCASRNLARRGRRSGDGPAARAEPSVWPEMGRWRLPADSGWRYARISGDFNPIHLWAWSARPFGLRRPIIQGMEGVARAAALIEATPGPAVSALSVSFRRPIELGSTVALHYDAPSGGFELWSGGQRAAQGRVTRAT